MIQTFETDTTSSAFQKKKKETMCLFSNSSWKNKPAK